MARVTTYLNFAGTTEAAFTFYKSVFGGDYIGYGLSRFGDGPPMEGAPPMSEETKKMIMHVELATIGGHSIMGSDAPAEFGFTVNQGNNFYINLETDTRAEADKLFAALSEGGTVTSPLQEMFWGAYYGTCLDKFGINWMFNCPNK